MFNDMINTCQVCEFEIKLSFVLESRYLIGCFTEKTIMLENGFPFIKISGENLGNVSSSCRDFCKRNQSKYSILKTSSKNKVS